MAASSAPICRLHTPSATILSFIDVQDYNTPPLEGLDGEIYQPGTVDYHAAMTELLLHGFNVGGDPKQFFRSGTGV